MLENRHLARWHAAGLIDEATRTRILAWERTEVRPTWLWAVAGVGGFALLLGVASLVAANWAVIPGAVKLGCQLLLDGAAAAALFLCWRAGRDGWRELAALLLYGLVLTSIGLVGQVYQLDGSVAGALLLWMLLTTPFMAVFTRSALLALAWVAGYAATCLMGTETLLRWLFGSAGSWDAEVLPLAWITTLLLLALGVIRGIQPATRRQGGWMEGVGCLALTAVASLPELLLRLGGSVDILERGWTAVAGAFVLLAGLVALQRRQQTGWRDLLLLLPLGGIATWWLTVFAVRAFAAPTSGELPEGAQLVVALLFVGFWALTGWLALRRGQRGLFLAAFLVITGRIFLFYWEAFGSLLSTGFGLILGGLLCLGLASLGWRLSRRSAAVAP